MARRAAEETPCQCNAAFLNSVVGHVTDVEQVNESSGNTEEADGLLETSIPLPLRSGVTPKKSIFGRVAQS